MVLNPGLGSNYHNYASRALDCLDTSHLPAFAREEGSAEIAVCLKEIIDRSKIPPWDEIPDILAIEKAGGFENLTRWRIPGTRITIARMEAGTQKHEYLFSAGTVERATPYFRSVADQPYRTTGPTTSPGFYKWYFTAAGHPLVAGFVERLPDRLRHGSTLGLANWKWPGLIFATILAVLLMMVIYRIDLALVRKTKGKFPLLYFITIVFPILAIAVPLMLDVFVRDYLSVRGTPLYIISFCSIAAATLAAVVLVFAAGNRIAETLIASPAIKPQGLNAQFIRIITRIMSVAISVAVVLFGGQYLGIPITTLLASAGIGGVALALGAQDTLKTLFGTLMLMADKPFRVGERIAFKNYDGVVEDVGLRSTRLRLLTSNQVTIPNDELARSDIENIGRRKHIRRKLDIHIPLDTPCAKVEKAAEIIKKELEDHEGMDPDYPPRAYFHDFLPDAFRIRVFYWYHPANYWEFMKFSEQFNLAIFRAFEKNDISFSLPERLTYTDIESKPSAMEIRSQDQG